MPMYIVYKMCYNILVTKLQVTSYKIRFMADRPERSVKMKVLKWMTKEIGNLEINCSMYAARELEEFAEREDVFVIGSEGVISDAKAIIGFRDFEHPYNDLLYKLRLSTHSVKQIEVEYNKDYDLLLTYATTYDNKKIYVTI